ncbi:MAG: hypothetical protein H6747_00490 [Deltaproteobacteria bacterium]|nr:hypothetical protein [Deltaproteobacteria bacterium]
MRPHLRTAVTTLVLALFLAQVADAAIIRRGLITRKGGATNYRVTLVAGGDDVRDVATVVVTIASLDGSGELVTMQAQRKGKNPGAVTFFEDFDDNGDSKWRRLTTTPLDGDGNAIGATTTVLVRVGGVGAGTGKLQGPELGEGTLIKGPQGWKITANVGGDTSQAHKVKLAFQDDGGKTKATLAPTDAKGDVAIFTDEGAPFEASAFQAGKLYKVEASIIGTDGTTIETKTLTLLATE